MRKLLIAITAGMLLLASAVSVSAESAARAKKGPGGPDPSCTQAQTASGPEQEKEQPESKTQDVENQQGAQEGQTGDAEGGHHDTGVAASSNDANDGSKEVKDDSTAEADQPEECGDQSGGTTGGHGKALKKGHDTTPSGTADSNRNDD